MIFISYSHLDSKWSADLLAMAAPLQRYGGLTIWSDSDIAAGSKWRSTIQNSLDKAKVAVLLVSRHFFASKFICDVELPCIMKAKRERFLTVLWVPLSHCLFDETPLKEFQAVLPPNTPLEAMRESEKNAALKKVAEKIKEAWLDYERPKINTSLNGKEVQRRVERFLVLRSPARRRVEVFVRADNSGDWYHQGAIADGQVGRTCHFGDTLTKPATGYHVLAITTDTAVPDQKGKPMKLLPKQRTRSKEVRVIRV